jgi:hypothetical protein
MPARNFGGGIHRVVERVDVLELHRNRVEVDRSGEVVTA